MFRRILIAIDGSPLADKALEAGLALAKAVNASVTLVTVSEKWSALEVAALVRMHVDEPIEKHEALAEKIAQRVLETAQAKAAPMHVQPVYIKNRAPAEGIIDTALAQSCDLIIMASHGRRGLREMILGSVTNEVLSTSQFPVLVVR